MKNPIINNRLVKDKTFATRLLHFAESIKVSDACGSDEKDSMISYATNLLTYQIETATDKEEKDYLNRVGVFQKYRSKRITTKDNFEVIANNDDTLYSCLKVKQKGDQILHINFKRLDQLKTKTRLYFKELKNCKEYIEKCECKKCKCRFDEYLYTENCQCNDGTDENGNTCNGCGGIGNFDKMVYDMCENCLRDSLNYL
jgi:hypothetical protein